MATSSPCYGCATEALPPYRGVALHRASIGKYEDQIWFTGTSEQALDFAGSTLLIASDA